MHRYFFIIIILAISDFAIAQEMRLITYNIRYDNADDGINRWDNRKVKLAGVIKKYDPDIFGIQEGLNNQVEDLKILLPGYRHIGVGRDDGKTKGEYSAIFYKKDRYKVTRDSTFWLSETPDVPGSKSWDAAITRICTWGDFVDQKSGDEFYVYNTHFDHKGETARLNSALLLREKVKPHLKASPVIIMGDFNSEPSEDPYHILAQSSIWELKDSYSAAAKNLSDTMCTFTGFAVNSTICKRIDFIFTNKKFDVKSFTIIHDNDGTYFFSDHLPVMAEVSIKKL